MGNAYLPLIDRFAEKVALDDNGCLIWTGGQAGGHGDDKYGVIGYQGRQVYAHQAAWFLAYGEWPAAGLQVDHQCLIKLCANVDHLEVVTGKVNMERTNGHRPDPQRCRSGKHDWVPENWTLNDGVKSCKLCRRESALARYYANR